MLQPDHNVTLAVSASMSASSVALTQYLTNSISRKQLPTVELLFLGPYRSQLYYFPNQKFYLHINLISEE